MFGPIYSHREIRNRTSGEKFECTDNKSVQLKIANSALMVTSAPALIESRSEMKYYLTVMWESLMISV